MEKKKSPAEYVEELVTEHLGLSAEQKQEFSMKAYLILELGADDLDTLEILMAIEEEYGVDMPDWDYKTSQDYVDKLVPLLEWWGEATST